MGGGIAQHFPFTSGKWTNILRRTATIKMPRLQALAGTHQAASRQQHFVFNHRAVHDNTAHADETTIANGAGVQQTFVPDGHVFSDSQRNTARRIRPVMGHMQHAEILNIAARTNADAVDIATRHGTRPQRHIVSQGYLADDQCRGVHVNPLAQNRSL